MLSHPLPLETFVAFTRHVQHEACYDEAAAVAELRALGVPEASARARGVPYVIFQRLLTGRVNEAFSPARAELHQRMTHPLTHYYIASSHRTYLVADQLVGPSSSQRFVDDLEVRREPVGASVSYHA